MDQKTAEITRLRDAVWAREERIRQLEEHITGARNLEIIGEALRFSLSPVEAKVWGVLRGRDIATQSAIYTVLYGARYDDPPEQSIVRRHIWSIRRKVHPHGWRIENLHGHGYRLVRQQQAGGARDD